MKIPVLVKNETWKKHMEKLNEEVKELQYEVFTFCPKDAKGDCKKIAGETFDIIQVAIGMLDKIEDQYPGMIKSIAEEHLIKLMKRGWSIKKVLDVRSINE